MLLTLMVGAGEKGYGQISTLSAWSNLFHNTTSPGNLTYTVPTGSNTNRVLVVAIASSQTGVAARPVTITYGSQTLTSVSGDMATTTVRQHTQLYYLNEAGLDAASSTTLAITISGGTTRVTDVFAAVFDNVDQSTPITNSQNYNGGTTNRTAFQFATTLTVNANDLAVEIISSVNTASTTVSTITYATNWTMQSQQTYATTNGVRNAVANRSVPGSNTTDVSATTFGTTSLASMSALSLKYYVPKYFRSLTSGNWNSTSTWQQSYDNSTWGAATTIPSSLDYLVTIQSGHTVTLTTNATASSLTINGNLDLNTFALTGTGTMTVSSTGTLLIGGISNFPTGFTTNTLSSGSTVNYDNGGSQTVAGVNYTNLILSGSGAKTLQAGTTSIAGTLTFSGTASATAVIGLTIDGDVILGSGTTFTAGAFTHNVAGNWTNNGGTFTSGTGTVTMIGTPKTIGGTSSTTFNNLTLGTSSTQRYTLGASQAVNGVLTVTNNVLLTLGSYNVTLGALSTISIATPYAGCMIVADGAGELRKIFTGNGSFTFPIGDATDGSAIYSPITLNFISGTYAVDAYASVKVTDTKHPNNSSVTNYLTRYWTLGQSGISAFSCNVTGAFDWSADIVGDWAKQSTAEYTGSLPWIIYSSLPSASTFTANGVTNFGDFTGVDLPTTITTSTTTGSPFCAGTNVSVPFTITGTYTSGNTFTAQLSNASGSFASPVAIGSITQTTAGTIAAVIPAGTSTGAGYRIRVVSTLPVVTGSDNGNNLIINAVSSSLSTTGGLICIGSTATLSASGAATGDRYKWYDAVTGGNLLKTSTDNTDNTYLTPVLG